MAPFDKSAPVAESVEKVEPVKEPEAEKTVEHRELEHALGIPLMANQLDAASQMLRMRQCDCTGSRGDFLRAPQMIPVPPEFT